MLEPGEPIAEQRLAEPIVIEPREVLRLRKEVVDLHIRFERQRAVVIQPLRANASSWVGQLVPFLLVILLEERAIADPAAFGRDVPAAFEPLAMLTEQSEAKIFLGHNRLAAPAEVVHAIIVDRPEIEDAFRRADEAEDLGPIV